MDSIGDQVNEMGASLSAISFAAGLLQCVYCSVVVLQYILQCGCVAVCWAYLNAIFFAAGLLQCGAWCVCCSVFCSVLQRRRFVGVCVLQCCCVAMLCSVVVLPCGAVSLCCSVVHCRAVCCCSVLRCGAL